MKSVNLPPKNGAWIVKNSWGSIDSFGQGINYNKWGVDGTGYFYLSYYDQSIRTAQCFDFDVDNKFSSNKDVTFNIYLVNGEAPSKDNTTLLASFEKAFPDPGLHITPLPEKITIEQGRYFAIETIYKYGEFYILSVGNEYNKKAFDAKKCTDKYAAVGVINKNESFIRFIENDIWIDFSEIKNTLENDYEASSYFSYDNFPIKAYGNYVK